MLRGMCRDEGLQERREAGISVTSLTGCLRASYFAIRTDYWQYPSRLWPAYRGTLGHLLIERGSDPENICETRFARYLDGVLVTGKPDEINPKRRLIIDYKTKEKFPQGVPAQYAEQLNCYRLLVADGYYFATGEHVSLEIEQLGLQFLTMSGYLKM